MKKYYLAKDERLLEFFQKLGFKRKGSDFYRSNDASIQSLAFWHSTQNQRFVKFYSINVSLTFPKILDITHEIGPLYEGIIGSNIGYLMPQNNFIEWRIAEEENENRVSEVIKEIIDIVSKDVMPVLDRYSSIENILIDYENGKFPFFMSYSMLPMLYYIHGEVSKAFHCLEKTISFVDNYEKKCYESGGIIELPKGIMRPARSLDMYSEFYKNLKEYHCRVSRRS